MSGTAGTITPNRQQALARSSATDTTITVAGVSTALLQAGDGPPMVLLHGPGEFGGTWLPVLDDLATTHRVIAPDLPGHGASDAPAGGIAPAALAAWLDELIAATCPVPPVLVGRVVGGAIAAEFAAAHPDRISGLVLVDTMGLAPFEPEPRFGLALHRFLGDPNQSSYERLMDFCAFDLDRARDRFGDRWAPFSGYAVELARDPRVQAATGAMIGLYGAQPLAPELLASISVPTTLIWGRQDAAIALGVAEAAAERYGWPLLVVDGAGDDPALDRPREFLEALHGALGSGSRS
jgi:pimeloyl-ACP methyl ester carboxylesterase